MMKPLYAALLAASLLLGGCEDGAPEQNVAKVRIAVPASEALKAMESDLYRFLWLRRAIVDSNQRCKKVDRGAYQEEYKSLAMWVAHCTDSGDWLIFIAASNDVQVRRCSEAAELKLPACKPLPQLTPAEEDKAKAAKAR